MAKLFFLLSGEHEDLPFSELKAILEAEGYEYAVLEKLDQIARLETDIRCVEVLKRRASMTRLCCQELFSTLFIRQGDKTLIGVGVEAAVPDEMEDMPGSAAAHFLQAWAGGAVQPMEFKQTILL